MASSPFTIVLNGDEPAVVYLKGSYEPFAWIYRQSTGGCRYRLASQPHKMSGVFGDRKAAIRDLEGKIK